MRTEYPDEQRASMGRAGALPLATSDVNYIGGVEAIAADQEARGIVSAIASLERGRDDLRTDFQLRLVAGHEGDDGRSGRNDDRLFATPSISGSACGRRSRSPSDRGTALVMRAVRAQVPRTKAFNSPRTTLGEGLRERAGPTAPSTGAVLLRHARDSDKRAGFDIGQRDAGHAPYLDDTSGTCSLPSQRRRAI